MSACGVTYRHDWHGYLDDDGRTRVCDGEPQAQAPEPQGGGLTADEREALKAVDALVLLLAHRGLVEVDTEDVWAVARLLNKVRPEGGSIADHFDARLATRAVPAETLADREGGS